MFLISLRVGLLLGWRQIQRSSIWVKTLVIVIMVLVFLNLVVVNGILVGLIEGSERANREQYTGEVILTSLPSESEIERTQSIVNLLDTLPSVRTYTVRYAAGGTIEANYRERRKFDELPDIASTSINGIDPAAEHAATGLADTVVEGEYLGPNDDQFVLLGANLLEKNLENFGNTDFQGLADVEPGSKLRITIGSNTKEYTVKGIADSKGGEVSLRLYMLDREFRKLTGRTNLNANEITIRTYRVDQANNLKQQLVRSGVEETAVIETWKEAQGQFLDDIKQTFSLLGTIIGFVVLIVAAITIFIIIFINAITRRKFIGILKGIGITETAIEFSYVIQSIFYAVVGSSIGLALTYFVIVPYFEANPIDFPFSDGIVSAPLGPTMIRLTILIVATIIAGYVPARMIVKKNTLDSILGR